MQDPVLKASGNFQWDKYEDYPFISIIIPTYNRREILKKCLLALLSQTYPHEKYEIIVIDDGSTDGTCEMIERLIGEVKSIEQSQDISDTKCPPYSSHKRLVYEWQEHASAASARNRGIRKAKGDLVIFLDSDIITLPDFIESHISERMEYNRKAKGLKDAKAWLSPHDRLIVHGRVIYTEDLDNPISTPKQISDISTAFFASGNVSIAKKWLIKAGLFDEDFIEYGWEDLELGQRLKKLGLRVIRSDKPKGYHLKHEFSVAKLPQIKMREIQRGRMAVVYYRKHPTFSVRVSTTMIRPFYWLIGLFTFWGWPDKEGTVRIIEWLDERGFRGLRGIVLQIMIYYWYIQGIKSYEGEVTEGN